MDNIEQGQEEVGKKRKANKALWKRSVVKVARLKGEEYVNSKGITVPSKATGPNCSCKRKNCFTISEDDQLEILKQLHDLSSKDEQDIHLSHLIDVVEVKCRKPRKQENARENSGTFKYHVLVSTQRKEVCLKGFLSLYSITIKRVKRLRSLKMLGKSPRDRRGQHVKKTFSEDITQLVHQHIQSFPQKETHYSNKTVKYLDARLNLKIMFSLFKEKHPNISMSYTYFRKFFNDNFNLSFGRPQIDCCCVCEELELKIKSPHLNEAAKRCAQAKIAVHKRKAKKFYSKLKSEVEESKQPHILAICYDYMQNVQLPRVPVQETFYLRQLTVNIFCIHDLNTNKSMVYIYHEGVAKKGPNEVCSFIYEFLKSVPPQYTELHVYSDNCGGQNKNHALSRMFLALTDSKKFTKVEQYFPIRGHSFLPYDRDFGIMKRQLKQHDRLFTVHEITECIVKSSTTQKFTVQEVQGGEILNFKECWPKYYKKTCLSNESKRRGVPKENKVSFMISSLMHLTYDGRFPAQIVGRSVIDGIVSHTFAIGQPKICPIIFPDGRKAYPLEKVPIKKKKMDDIKKLLAYVPHEHEGFYTDIISWPTTDGNENDSE